MNTAALFACLLVGHSDCGPALTLPDAPPGLPCPAECARISWQVWDTHLAWAAAGDGLTGWRDREPLRAGQTYWHDASWAWWHAGRLQDVSLCPEDRRAARRALISLVDPADYLSGHIPLPEAPP